MEQFTVTFLPVPEDFARFKMEYQKQSISRKQAFLITLTAIVIIVVSLYSVLFFPDNKLKNILFISLGLLIAALPDILLPWIVYRNSLRKAIKESGNFISKTITVNNSSILISSDRISYNLPYEMLYKTLETPALFLLFLGSDDVLYIPKRVMDTDQIDFLREQIQQDSQTKM